MTNEETQKFINERIEALKLELESKFIRVTKAPEFEDGVWYKSIDDVMYGLYNAKNTHKCNGFIDSSYYVDIKMTDSCFWQKVTDFTELEELLKKEAVKKGMVDGAKIKGYTIKYPLKFDVDFKLFIDANYNTLMDSDGTWAEVVKEKTTQEWIKDFKENSRAYNLYEYLEQNNLEITRKK